MEEEEERPRRKQPEARKRPRKISPRYLENSALHYLKRYSSTVSQLRRVMLRKINRSLREHGGDKLQAVQWLDALAEKLVRNGLLNDQAYAETKTHSLRNAGRSTRVIAMKLRMKGVSAELVTQQLDQATRALSEDDAAKIWARKKRLGPFRRDVSTRKDLRQKDLASLARAGFSFGIAKKVIDGTAD
ncbi:MAG: RecX family transcriptional regulator [Myxococcota bacterium]|nr:RecX family transcriptional regulator [Myxococcota bacterium]